MSTYLSPRIESIRGRWRHMRTAETAVRKRFWQSWQNPSGQTRPVFLVGCGRSGTTMLIRHLGRSCFLDVFNEDHPAVFVNWRLRDLAVVETVIVDSHAVIALIKPILNTYQTCQLLAHFPTAKVIFAYRHYNDVINSSLKRFGTMNRYNHVHSWMGDDFGEFPLVPIPEPTKELIRCLWRRTLNPESGAALYWLFYNALFFDLHLDQNERVYLSQYKTLVSQPEHELQDICAFLDLSYEAKMAEGIFTSSIARDDSPVIDELIRDACDMLWQRLCQHNQQDCPQP